MKLTLRIQRYNPETDKEPYYQEFAVEAEPSDRVLDALMYVKRHLDGTLAVRKSCAHGICGSDAMRINGVERLACKTLVKEVAEGDGSVVVVEPLRSMPVQRDLMVDQTLFFQHYRSVRPYLLPAQPPPEKEYLQKPEDHSKIDDQTQCILCAACYSACPIIAEKNPRFIGPAAVVQASRFVFDNRDEGLPPRLAELDAPDGVWPCETRMSCTRACPRGIKVTRHINVLKRHIDAHKEDGHQTA